MKQILRVVTGVSVGAMLCAAGTLGVAQAADQDSSAQKLSDPQIAAVVEAANEVDIQTGKLAEKESKNSQVKQFAGQMVQDHTSVNKQTKNLVSQLGVKPQDNPTSKLLKDQGKNTQSNLKNLKGPEFDRAYVDHEVAYHKSVLDTIDNTLIPNAKNPQLKAFLQKVRPSFQAHLEHAQSLQDKMNQATG